MKKEDLTEEEMKEIYLDRLRAESFQRAPDPETQKIWDERRRKIHEQAKKNLKERALKEGAVYYGLDTY